MNRTISSALTLTAGALLSTSVFAASLNGTQWQTIDDKTGEKKAIIQLNESNGKVSGKIIKVLNKEEAKAVCTKCHWQPQKQANRRFTDSIGLKG